MYDFTSAGWTSLPELSMGRFGHGCGMVTKSDGTREAVVAGGNVKSIEIYHPQSNKWRYAQQYHFKKGSIYSTESSRCEKPSTCSTVPELAGLRLDRSRYPNTCLRPPK